MLQRKAACQKAENLNNRRTISRGGADKAIRIAECYAMKQAKRRGIHRKNNAHDFDDIVQDVILAALQGYQTVGATKRALSCYYSKPVYRGI